MRATSVSFNNMLLLVTMPYAFGYLQGTKSYHVPVKMYLSKFLSTLNV